MTSTSVSAHVAGTGSGAGSGVAAGSGAAGKRGFFVPLLHRQVLERAQRQIAGRKRLYPALAQLNVPPPYHALNLLKVIWTMLGYGPDRLGDAAAPAERADKRAFSWSVARTTITPAFVQELVAFDAEAVESGPSARAVERLKAVLENMLDKEVNEQGPTFTPLLAWAKAAVAIRDTCLEQRERNELLRDHGLL